MEYKNLYASIFLKNGQAVGDRITCEPVGDLNVLAKCYNDSGTERLLIFYLSTTEEEHRAHISLIKKIHQTVEIPICAGGHINQLDDIKKLLYAGCSQIMLNSFKESTIGLIKEASERFGKEKITVTLENLDILFKHREHLETYISEIFVFRSMVAESLGSLTSLPYIVMENTYDEAHWIKLLSSPQCHGIFGPYIDHVGTDIMKLKRMLFSGGIQINRLEATMDFSQFKKDADGLVPVIVQDYQSNEVLMLGYMNEEAYLATLASGRMTYYSRSRKCLREKGAATGNYQYVKELSLDCDDDTILAKISQVGVACHTGSYSCFIQELVKRDYKRRDPQRVLEDVYDIILDRKKNPREGSYTNFLLDQGTDELLKKLGVEATEVILSAKNHNPEAVKYELSDLLYHCMVLMAQQDITWDDLARELIQR